MPRSLICWLAGLLLPLAALTSADTPLPSPLEPWRQWVLDKHPDTPCPFLYNTAQRHCQYPISLELNATAEGASFNYQVEMFRDGWVTLPGSEAFWPMDVRNQGLAAVVREQGARPQVWLETGRHQLSGQINWKSLPRSLTLPAETGILRVTVNGQLLGLPTIDQQEQLWFARSQQQTAGNASDTLDIRVFRLLEDQIPLTLTTRLELNVSGREREVVLGPLLLEGFTPRHLDSQLPARLEEDGNLRIQVKPGRHLINLTAWQLNPQPTLSFTPANEFWPQQEVWAFSARRDLRTLQPVGVSSIDPGQTGLPEAWQQLPTWLVTPDTRISFEILQRGSSMAGSNQLSLQKDLWLDFDGKGFTVRDVIRGTFNEPARLDSQLPYEPGSLSLNGEPQVITRLPAVDNSGGGVEIRLRNPEVIALSRIEDSRTLPVSGWQQDVSEVNARLHLSPGWSLLNVSGASQVTGSWVSLWSLWDIFLVLIITVILARSLSPWIGALALVTLLVTYHRTNAPVFIWLNIAATLALLPLVSGQFKRYLQGYHLFSFILLALICLPFAVKEARQFFYPQLDAPWKSITQTDYSYAPHAIEEAVIAEAPLLRAESAVKAIRSAPAADAVTNNKIPVSRQYDPAQQTQTGPGVPQWQWNAANISWNGPILASDSTRLYLIPPVVNRLCHLLSALLPFWLAFLLLKRSSPGAGKLPARLAGWRQSLAPCLLLGGALLFSGESVEAASPIIDKELLSELETRLTRAPACLPDCASIERANLQVEEDQLSLTLTLHAADTLAFPLPAQQWRPDLVTLDERPAALRYSGQQLFTVIPAGRHQVRMEVSLAERDELTLGFPLAAHNLQFQLKGWQINGAGNDSRAATSLQLVRQPAATTEAAEERLVPGRIPPFVSVTRRLSLGLEWTVETLVQRMAPAQGVINLEIPLLPGEAPVSGEAGHAGHMAVRLAADAPYTRWESVLRPADSLLLQAPTEVPWVEIWELESSPVWHVSAEGIPPVQSQHQDLLTRRWQPWPGEQVALDITRPGAIEGRNLTISSVNLAHSAGSRATTTRLELSIRANQASQYSFALPEGARLEQLTIDQRVQPLGQTSGELKLPLRPGEQTLLLEWQTPGGAATYTATPALELGSPGFNQSLSLRLPTDRWLLLTGGPAIGPAVLIWGILAVVLLIAIGLGRSRLTPLKTWEWVLLGLGIATVNLYALVFVAAWLVLLNRRGKLQQLPAALSFKWMQVGLFGLSLLSLGLLLASIPLGLLSSPEMYITGNASSAWLLQWYQDMTNGAVPEAWAISLPIGWYRIIMLIWSLWLAFALLRWCKWGWLQLGHLALWYTPDEESAAQDKPAPAREDSDPAS